VVEGTVFIVDDDAAVRKSLDMLVRSVGLPVKAFSSAQEFLDNYRADQPGCLVLDIRMPGMSGLELQRHMKDVGIAIPIIIITGHGDVPIAVRAMKDGAMELLEKPFSKQLLLEHIGDALRRDHERRQKREQKSDVESRLTALTQREREVMELVVAGKANKEIAAALGISKKTVDVHRSRVMHKMQVESLPELVQLAIAARDQQPDA
jgi:RNA polymerase sigma factor (sigma-70 family)